MCADEAPLCQITEGTVSSPMTCTCSRAKSLSGNFCKADPSNPSSCGRYDEFSALDAQVRLPLHRFASRLLQMLCRAWHGRPPDTSLHVAMHAQGSWNSLCQQKLVTQDAAAHLVAALPEQIRALVLGLQAGPHTAGCCAKPLTATLRRCALLQGQTQQQADYNDDLTKSNSVVFNTFIFMQVGSAECMVWPRCIPA